MFQNNKKWIFLFLLAFIWGSSFILIKKGLVGFTPLQLGSLRIIITALLLFLVGFKSLKNLPKNTLKWIVISGFLGTFFPAFLFAYAETEIDSAIASILNSIVPINTIIFGFLAFKIYSSKRQILGVLIGFTGTFFWIDPKVKLSLVFLTNRVYPSRKNEKLYEKNIRSKLLDIVFEDLKITKND